MRRKNGLRLVIAVAMAAMGIGGSASADVLRIGGTGAATEMLKRIGAAFAVSSETEVKVVPSLGTGGALRAVVDGALDIAVAGRPLNREEAVLGLTQVAVVRTPFGLATSHRNPNGLKSADIAAIFALGDARWADGTPIRVILRPKSDSDTLLLASLFPGMSAALDRARKRAEVPTAATDQDNADTAERVPGSLAGAAFTQIEMEKRNLRFVAIDGVALTLEDFERGTYSYAKTMRFVTSAAPQEAVTRFIAFLKSPAGQRALRETGTLPGED